MSPVGAPSSMRAPLSLPAIKGGAVGYQAARALGDGPDASRSGLMPGAMVPRRLQPLSPHTALGTIPEQDKGKGPISGRPTVKKSPHASSEEDVSGAEGTGGSATGIAPPFSPTRSLAPIGMAPVLPSIGGVAESGRLPAIRRNLSLKDLPAPLGPRRVSTDPFSAEPLSPIQTVPLSPVRSLPLRPSMAQSPKKATDKDT